MTAPDLPRLQRILGYVMIGTAAMPWILTRNGSAALFIAAFMALPARALRGFRTMPTVIVMGAIEIVVPPLLFWRAALDLAREGSGLQGLVMVVVVPGLMVLHVIAHVIETGVLRATARRAGGPLPKWLPDRFPFPPHEG